MSIQSYARINGVDPASQEDLVTYRPASCLYNLSAWTTGAPLLTAQTIPFDTRVFDDAGAYNTTTHVWTCPYPGVYMFVVQLGLNIVVQQNFSLLKNASNTVISARGPYYTTSAYYEQPMVFINRFVAGDTATPQFAINQASVPMRGGIESFLSIGYLHP